jgi:hypothetical protein
LPRKEKCSIALDLHVPVAQRGQTERSVRARVLVVAHPDEGLVEQPHHRGEDLSPGQVARAQVALDLLAQGGEDLTELQHPAELRLVARLAIERMVAVLLAAAGVARGGLDVALRIGADPHVGPGRGDDQRFDAAPLAVGDARAVGRVEGPARALALPADAGHAVGDVTEPGARRRLAMFIDPQRRH